LVHKRSVHARKIRNKNSREKRKRQRESIFDQKTGEIINIQPRYIEFEIVPETLGFSSSIYQSEEKGTMFLHQGEVLIDWRGDGTIQTHPEVFI